MHCHNRMRFIVLPRRWTLIGAYRPSNRVHRMARSGAARAGSRIIDLVGSSEGRDRPIGVPLTDLRAGTKERFCSPSTLGPCRFVNPPWMTWNM